MYLYSLQIKGDSQKKKKKNSVRGSVKSGAIVQLEGVD
jgi:hypothetical protein